MNDIARRMRRASLETFGADIDKELMDEGWREIERLRADRDAAQTMTECEVASVTAWVPVHPAVPDTPIWHLIRFDHVRPTAKGYLWQRCVVRVLEQSAREK